MDDDFRRRATDDIARLLAQWRVVEFWIKKAEQINKQALIPAINELRYASRQLFNAIVVMRNEPLTEAQKSIIRRRIIIAEQYLYNAEHDIADAITGFYDELTEDLDHEFGRSSITILFPEYPLLLRCIREASNLIADARHDYEKRAVNYKTLRDNHFPQMAAAYERLLEAEVSAREQKGNAERDLVVAQGKITALTIFSIIAGLAAIITLPLTIYLWILGFDDYCALHSQDKILGIVCRMEDYK